MPDIYGNAGSDAWIQRGAPAWAGARDATSGLSIGRTGPSGTRSKNAMQAITAKGEYRVTRSFLFYDTSGISEEPESATLRIWGYVRSVADFFVVRSDANAEITVDEFDSIVGWNSSGVDNESNVTKLSDEITTWNTGEYNTITLNAEARLRMYAEDLFVVCLIESVHDLRNVAPMDAEAESGMFFTDQAGTTYDPYLSYTLEGAVTDNATFFGCNF